MSGSRDGRPTMRPSILVSRVVTLAVGPTTAPLRSPMESPIREVQEADAAAAPMAQLIELHGTKGRVYRYTIVGSEVYTSETRHATHEARHIALLRRMAAADKRIEALVKIVGPIWKAHGLDVDAAVARGAATHGGRPGSPRPSLGDGASAMVDTEACMNLYIDLYNTTRDWHGDVDTLTSLETAWTFYGCGLSTDPTSTPSFVCGDVGGQMLIEQTIIDVDLVNLNSIGDEIYFMGCISNA